MSYLLLACQILLAIILLLASVSKIFYQEQFLIAIRLSGFPKTIIRPIALFIPGVELCLALGLVMSSKSQMFIFVVTLTAALFCVFTLWMCIVYYRGLRLKCGCFGIGKSDIGPATIFRNILLIALSFVVLIIALHIESPLFTPSSWMRITITCCGMSLLLVWAFQQAFSGLNISLAQLNKKASSFALDSQAQKQGGM